GITTDETRSYEWNGIELIDTPGIHTELRPDHDAITYEAISRADLLVFLVTNELFDAHIGEHFRKLAIDRGKGHEMMLVVNKMERCADGNTPEVQEILREDLRKVLHPFTPEELRISFIDAESAWEAMHEEDEEIQKLLYERSGIGTFVEHFDAFVEEKGLTGKYSTALYEVEQVLIEALQVETGKEKKPEQKSYEHLLMQRRRLLRESEAKVKASFHDEIVRTATQVEKEGRQVAALLVPSADRSVVNERLSSAQRAVESHVQQLIETLRSQGEQEMEALGDRLEKIWESPLGEELRVRCADFFADTLPELEISPETWSKMKGGANMAARLGQFLTKASFNPEARTFAGLLEYRSYSQTPMHEAVKRIGKFFGKTFKPWEAVKWTRRIAGMGRMLSVAGVFLSFALDMKAEADARRLEEELRESRNAIRAGFGDAADLIECHFDRETNRYLAETIEPEIERIDRELDDLRKMQEQRSERFTQLKEALEEAHSLIGSIHGQGRKALGL
ncbi:MAG: hypothetical protein D6795_01075, partial [Deltaproteobacteria bacterium]